MTSRFTRVFCKKDPTTGYDIFSKKGHSKGCNIITTIKSTNQNTTKIVNPPTPSTSIITKYGSILSDIRAARKVHGMFESPGEHGSEQSKETRKKDIRYQKMILLLSTVGTGVGLTIISDYNNNEQMFYTVHDNFIVSSIFGGGVGCFLAIVYPYPKFIATLIFGGSYFLFTPTIIQRFNGKSK